MLKEIIDQFYLDRQRDKEQHHFYITDAGKCPRSIFFKFKNAPRKKMEARVLRMFDHGNSIHQLIMRPLLSTKEIHVVASEVNIPPQELISGRADAVISDGRDLYLLDIKSINGMIFNNLVQPKEEHINQIQLYLHFLDPKKGILLYINKDTQEFKEFPIDYNPDLVSELLSNLKELKKKIDSDTVPFPLPDRSENWQCKYCQFRKICEIAGVGEVDWKNFKTKIESFNEK